MSEKAKVWIATAIVFLAGFTGLLVAGFFTANF